MCGGLVVMSPGEPSQVVCAILIMGFHFSLVLKTAPYVKDSEDWSSVVSAFGLTILYIGAVIKILQVEVRKSSLEDAKKLEYVDGIMSAVPIVCVTVVVLIMIFVDCGLWNCMLCKKGRKRKGSPSLDQVMPIDIGSTETEEAARKKQERELKNWDFDKK